MNVQFERRMGSKLVLDSWVDVSKLDLAQNPVQDLCARGYKMPSDGNGATFTVGNIAFEPESAGARTNTRI